MGRETVSRLQEHCAVVMTREHGVVVMTRVGRSVSTDQLLLFLLRVTQCYVGHYS